MPSVKSCRRCGRLFNYNGSAVCDSCRKEETQEAKRIKDYVAANPKAAAVEISSALHIRLDRVQEYLKRHT